MGTRFWNLILNHSILERSKGLPTHYDKKALPIRLSLTIAMLSKFSFGRVSLSKVGVYVGLALTLAGFYAYAVGNSTLNLAGFFYGIPILLGGLALTSSELDPVPMLPMSAESIVALRDAQATDTLKQVRLDVTRFRYGQEAHLELALNYLGLNPNDDDRPMLMSIREENRDGAYGLVLTFSSPEIPLETWTGKLDKITKFFGPNVLAEIIQPVDDAIDLALIVQPKKAKAQAETSPKAQPAAEA
jgi:hypothetical protein